MALVEAKLFFPWNISVTVFTITSDLGKTFFPQILLLFWSVKLD